MGKAPEGDHSEGNGTGSEKIQSEKSTFLSQILT